MEAKPSQIDNESLVEINREQIENNVALKIEKLKQLPIIAKAFEMLDALPDYLRYHAKSHTEDVFHEAVLFGMVDGLGGKEIERLAVAAAWHDVGYLVRPKDSKVYNDVFKPSEADEKMKEWDREKKEKEERQK